MFSFLKKSTLKNPLPTDIHSHLLPGLDDGVANFDEALKVVRQLQEWGYKKLITTPHVMSNNYPNTRESIREKWLELKNILAQNNITVELEMAAEYYFDAWLAEQFNTDSSMMTFGKNYLLFELNYMTEPYQLNTFIFKLFTLGYRPVLAHPERYNFMTIEKAEDLYNRGVFLQLNVMSFTDYYNKSVRSLARQLVDKGFVHFLGTDCHGEKHFAPLADAFKTTHFKKALDLPLLNYQL